MYAALMRSLKRLLILAAGLIIIYLAVWRFFPFFDHRIPIALALLATYIFTAYIYIPAAIRVMRVFVKPAHIPLYCVTPDGFASDPINIGIIGTKVEIIKAMKKAGWHKADKRTARTVSKMILCMILRRPYPNAPFSTLYLFGRQQDLGFEKAIESKNGSRHHVRFWACEMQGPEDFVDHVRFWKRFHKRSQITDIRQFWIGAASKDIGIMPIRHNAQLTHMIDPDTNSERDKIVADLKDSGYLDSKRKIKVGSPYQLKNRVLGGFLQTDGKMTICVLK